LSDNEDAALLEQQELKRKEDAAIATKIASELTDEPEIVSEELIRTHELKMETINLSHWYGANHVLSGISLPMFKNRVTAIIGASGCGKSTFLRDLNRMNDLISSARIAGQVLLDGQDIYEKNVDLNQLRKRIGMVFQKANPFAMSIENNIAYGPYVHGINEKEFPKIIEGCLRKAVLWDEVKNRLGDTALSLSGGQ